MADKPDGRHARMEKYLLRKAFDRPEQPYLPERVLWRQKEQFSDGVGYSWVDGLKAHAAKARLFRHCLWLQRRKLWLKDMVCSCLQMKRWPLTSKCVQHECTEGVGWFCGVSHCPQDCCMMPSAAQRVWSRQSQADAWTAAKRSAGRRLAARSSAKAPRGVESATDVLQFRGAYRH